MRLVAALLLLVSLLCPSLAAANDALMLWYDHPAADWEKEALGGIPSRGLLSRL